MTITGKFDAFHAERMSITVKRSVVRCHKRKSYMARLFLTLIILMPICAPTFAGTTICWIDHVTGDVSGVRVFFRKNADIWGRLGHRPGEHERRYSVRQGRIVWPDREEAALLVQPGETSMVIGGVENTCELALRLCNSGPRHFPMGMFPDSSRMAATCP
jgi:hypothetical protein